jgi:hypothetical protein
VHRFFKRREPVELCNAILVNGPMTTWELMQHIMKAKDLDGDDKVLAKALGNRLIHSLRMQA